MSERETWIKPLHFAAKSDHHCRRIAIRAYDHRHVRKGSLQVWPPETWLGAGAAGLIFHVAHHAYNAHPVGFFGMVVECEALGDRVLVGPVSPRHGLVDDRHPGRAVFVRIVEETARNQ